MTAALLAGAQAASAAVGRIVVTVRDMATGAVVDAASRGDRAAWDELVDRFGRLVYAVARSFRLPNPDVADVYQTVWLRFAEHIDHLREPDRAGAWLATTTRNECLRVVRTATRTVLTDEFDEPGGDAPPDDPVVLAEERAALREAFARLPERCRRLLWMVVDPGYDYDAIGVELAMPKGSIGPTRGRCLQRLKNELAAVYPVAGAWRGQP